MNEFTYPNNQYSNNMNLNKAFTNILKYTMNSETNEISSEICKQNTREFYSPIQEFPDYGSHDVMFKEFYSNENEDLNEDSNEDSNEYLNKKHVYPPTFQEFSKNNKLYLKRENDYKKMKLIPINCTLPKIDSLTLTEPGVNVIYNELFESTESNSDLFKVFKNSESIETDKTDKTQTIYYHNEVNTFKNEIENLSKLLTNGYEDPLTIIVAKCAYTIWTEIGPNYLEKNYRDALYIELLYNNIKSNTEFPIALTHRGHAYGEGYIDILVPGKLVIELKAEKSMNSMQVYRQCKKYMKSLNIRTGMVINFPKRDKFDPLEIIKIITNDNDEVFNSFI